MNDGGPKYPFPTHDEHGAVGEWAHPGQTRWQSLAETTMGAWLSSWPGDVDCEAVKVKGLAAFAYDMADAMLAEEERRAKADPSAARL